eukprot:NODE_18216_length_904_cov_4.971686.p1 GENE.NODE_18216_length_904_cov_4.971686~~NODE_18216_length_904_cov_4.971686.p1  ORF type:complete len:262 (-),score=80.51 NODE_18216_length_904_cov_4.971686:70-855(-)
MGRFPFEWQRAKEHAWSNPRLVVAATLALGAVAVALTVSCWVLGGRAVYAGLFAMLAGTPRRQDIDVRLVSTQLSRTLPQELEGSGWQHDEAMLASHVDCFCSLGILASAIPALVALAGGVLLVLGELRRERVEQLHRSMALAALWSAGYAAAAALACWHWRLYICMSVEQTTASLCERDSAWAAILCFAESAADCLLLALLLGAHFGAALLLIVATLLGLCGTQVERERCQQSHFASGVSAARSERWGLCEEPRCEMSCM